MEQLKGLSLGRELILGSGVLLFDRNVSIESFFRVSSYLVSRRQSACARSVCYAMLPSILSS